eukprot:CAMPEP_0203664756 /NCGR_PEP_ID=MMETSP0090-20130426/2111_1 /ASSEMBLY_ACC=CAM_ASM_001088 /TAXON_ID=426623 /ORGANISM="Chaetoceros affinis, Strain CCMP159" /LENGTH=290 /DNA_ID=CAMNT_0050528107 /DNA_START=34 /DNA_END=906 /DNA_ORIENTATION=-
MMTKPMEDAQCPDVTREYELESDETYMIQHSPSDFIPSTKNKNFPSSERSLMRGLGEWTVSSMGKKTKTDDFDEGRCYEEMGIAKAKCGNITEALCLFDLALQAKREECSGSDDADLINMLLRARAFNKKWFIENKTSDLIRSCSLYKEVIKLKQKTRPVACVQHASSSSKKDDLFLATILIELAQVQCQRGDLTSAILNFNRALNIRVGYLGTSHEDVGYIWFLLGKIYHMKKEYKEAMVAYRNSHKIYSLEGRKKTNQAIIQAIQRFASDKTMLAEISEKHWNDNSTV